MPEREHSEGPWLGVDEADRPFFTQLRERPGFLRGALVLAILAGGISLAQRASNQPDAATTVATSPSPLTPYLGPSPALAYDAKHHQVVLFNNAGQTWLWSGQRWTLAHPPVSPPARWDPLAAWDPKTGQVLLFGGLALDDGKALTDFWAWTGTTWAVQYGLPASDAGGLVAGALAMAYDERTQEITALIAVGRRTETWSWDGSRWQRRAETGPMGVSVTMASDASSHDVIAVAQTAADSSAETWRWDGTRWRRLAPAHAPGGSAEMSMAADPASNGTLLLSVTGQVLGVPTTTETWIWSGLDWVQRPPAGWKEGAVPVVVSAAVGSQREVLAFADVTPQRTTCLAATAVWAWTSSGWHPLHTASGNSATSGCE